MSSNEPKKVSFSRADRWMKENNIKGETQKARKRRLAQGWFEKYAPSDKIGLDIGAQHDPLNHTFRRWDVIFGDGDAAFLETIPDETFYTVYASHVLEHLSYPEMAIENWYRVLKPGGCLIILVPHRDLYEKKKYLPSNWNPEHKYFWLPDDEELPCTRNLKKTIMEAIADPDIVSFEILDEGYDYSMEPHEHPIGEVSIEAIIKKHEREETEMVEKESQERKEGES